MQTVISLNVDDLDSKFVETLKRDFAHATLEIRLQAQVNQQQAFTEADFWEAIEMLDWSKEGNDDNVIEPLIINIERLPIAHIYRFYDILSEKLWQLDTYDHAKIFLDDPEEEGLLSVDDFLYTRCAVVANGQKYFEKILENPHFMPPDLTFEPLLYVALKAYKRKTGNKFSPISAYNYETYSNKNGWKQRES